MQNFALGQKSFNESILYITKKACEWIDFDQKNFALTYQAAMKEQSTAQEL